MMRDERLRAGKIVEQNFSDYRPDPKVPGLAEQLFETAQHEIRLSKIVLTPEEWNEIRVERGLWPIPVDVPPNGHVRVLSETAHEEYFVPVDRMPTIGERVFIKERKEDVTISDVRIVNGAFALMFLEPAKFIS